MKKKLLFALSVTLIVMLPLLAAPKVFSQTQISVYIDGQQVQLDAAPVIVADRTLVPIRTVAETIGAEVSWNGSSRTVTIIRASKEINITIGEKTAIVNGVYVPLEVPAMISEERTMLPLRFVAEQLSQNVGYDAETKSVYITENYSFEGSGNLSAWFLGCGAIIAEVNNCDPYTIGTYSRSAANREMLRRMLSNSWSCDSREDIIETIKQMTDSGHNASFQNDASLLRRLTDEEFEQLVAQSQGVDKYMFPYVRTLDKKWGDKGIKAWDWFRMFHLAGWGYKAGYLELEEAYELVAPVAQNLQETFSSWDEATENYLDGYAYWSRIDVSVPDTEYRNRLQMYENLKVKQNINGLIFDPQVWAQPVQIAQ